ncbi:hypothetical protein Y032_0116g620 [Ancylostoma ceylanicum]|uniref:Uncharacterized protein n=1 Tax=Ancylostoma ceylanicum TaxID=53326 RepID=A0A016TCR0_9BILA|nr:hypothetical protein Y032_0116g620 [Ancylostoma ceylanicum]
MGVGWITDDVPEPPDLSDWMSSLSSFWENDLLTEKAMMWSQKHDGSSTLLGSNRQGITEDVSYEPACKRTKFLPMVNSSGYDDEVLDINRITFKDSSALKGFVLRSTRFSVVVPIDVAISMFVYYCEELGTIAKQRADTEFLVTFKPNMSFVMNAYEFSDTDGTRVIVDCRRSRGCGIAFKRIFNHIKKKMQPLIYRDDYDWMKNAGLTRKN